jgi:hypothetical protein
MNWNPYSDLPWSVHWCYYWNYFSEQDRSVWIRDCLTYGSLCDSINFLAFQEIQGKKQVSTISKCYSPDWYWEHVRTGP